MLKAFKSGGLCGSISVARVRPGGAPGARSPFSQSRRHLRHTRRHSAPACTASLSLSLHGEPPEGRVDYQHSREGRLHCAETMPSPQPGRFRVGNVLRLAHAPPPSPDQIRLSASLPRFSPRGYEPLSPASPRQPLLSPSSMHPMTPSLPPTPSSPSFSDGGVYSGHTREPGVGTQDGRLLPNTLASIRKRTRLKSCTVFVLVLAALAIAGYIAWSTNLHVPSEQTVRFYASRIGNGLRPWTDSVEPTEQSEPASSAATIPSRLTGPIKAAEEDTVSESADIPISTLPKLEPPSAADQSVKYLGYLPHSGFHNQRIELQSALLLGKVLNRTV